MGPVTLMFDQEQEHGTVRREEQRAHAGRTAGNRGTDATGPTKDRKGGGTAEADGRAQQSEGASALLQASCDSPHPYTPPYRG